MFKKICCAVIMGFLILSSQYAHAVSLRLEVPPNPMVGSPFNIRALVDGVDASYPLIAFGFNASAPGDWLLQSAVVGPLFDDASSLFGGDPEVAGTALPGVFGDDILLATLTYVPGSVGTFSFQITSDISDPNEGLFFYDLVNNSSYVVDLTTSIQVNTVIPEPATIALLGGGLVLLGLGGIRRRIDEI